MYNVKRFPEKNGYCTLMTLDDFLRILVIVSLNILLIIDTLS